MVRLDNCRIPKMFWNTSTTNLLVIKSPFWSLSTAEMGDVGVT